MAAALYLACKVEETPKPVAVVAEAVFSISYRHRRKVLEMLRNRVSYFSSRHAAALARLGRSPGEWTV